MSARSRNTALLLLIVVGPLAALGIGIAIRRATGGPPAPPQPVAAGALTRANLLLVTISALRSDHLGVYGSAGSLTPAIDTFAKEGLRFERTYAHVPSTAPSHRTLMTATYPNRREPTDTLAERLEADGYRTGAFVGSTALGANAQLAPGFDRYDDERLMEGSSRDATRVFEAAYDWIATWGSGPGARGSADAPHVSSSNPQPPAPSPWFCWVQLDDPREPYSPPEPFRSQYTSEPYDGEVAYVDGAFGVFVQRLRRIEALTDTIVVIAADHGEALGEHGAWTDGALPYDATIRVPLIVWAPPRIRPGVFEETMRLVDVAPTLLDLLGMAPLAGVDGRSVRGFLGTGQPFDDRESYFEADGRRGVVRGRYKLIAGPAPELYDLVTDPGEQRNVYGEQPAIARELEAILDAIVKSGRY